MAKLLETENLGIAFGGLRALSDVTLEIGRGEIVGLIGPNGAGKTTVFNLLTDVYMPTEGTITLESKSIVGKKTYQITRAGIARTFQNIRLFKGYALFRPGWDFAAALLLAGGKGGRPAGAGASAGGGSGGFCGRQGQKPALWPAAQAGDRPGAGNAAQGSVAG